MTAAGQVAQEGSLGNPRVPVQDQAFLERWRAGLEDPKKKFQLVKLLTKTLMLADTTDAFREAVVDRIQVARYHEGQVVFRQSEPGDWMAIVLTGRLERKLQRRDREVLIGDVGPGGIVGDMGLFGICPVRSFTVTSIESSVLLILTMAQFNQAVCTAGGPVSLSLFRDGQEMENLMADTESFLELACFKTLDKDFVMALHENSEPMLCYPNQVLMKENAYGNEMYILRKGQVRVEKAKKLIVTLGSGVVLGELAVLGSDKRRKATVTCSSLCLIRTLHGDVFHDILNQFPRAKRVFDHAYIARLVSIEMQSAGEELRKLDQFYGSATPRTGAQMVQMFGGKSGTFGNAIKALEEASGSPRKDIMLPRIKSPRKASKGNCFSGSANSNSLFVADSPCTAK